MGNAKSRAFRSIRSEDSEDAKVDLNEAKLEKMRSAKEDFEKANNEFQRGHCESAKFLYRLSIDKITTHLDNNGLIRHGGHELVMATSSLGVQMFAEGKEPQLIY
jgi:hypothetical protein